MPPFYFYYRDYINNEKETVPELIIWNLFAFSSNSHSPNSHFVPTCSLKSKLYYIIESDTEGLRTKEWQNTLLLIYEML